MSSRQELTKPFFVTFFQKDKAVLGLEVVIAVMVRWRCRFVLAKGRPSILVTSPSQLGRIRELRSSGFGT